MKFQYAVTSFIYFSHKAILFSICSLLSIATFSQSNFLDAKIITLKNDTISGQINYRSWVRTPERIQFKDETGMVVNYSPIDISGFQVNNMHYVGAIVEFEKSAEFSNLSTSPEPIIGKDTTFLQVLVSRSKSLFYYKGFQNKNYFYILSGSKYELLIHKKFIRELNGTRMESENNLFVGQLSYYLKDCDNIITKLNNVKYEVKSMINIFNDYHDCTNSAISYQRKNVKTKLFFGILGGMTLTKIAFPDASYPYLGEFDLLMSKNFGGGLFFDQYH